MVKFIHKVKHLITRKSIADNSLRFRAQKFDTFENLKFKTEYIEVLQNFTYFGKFKSVNILTEYLKFQTFWLPI